MATRRPCLSPPPPRPCSLDIRRALGYPPSPPCPWPVGPRTAPDDSYPDDRCPVALHPFFSGYRFRPTRRQGRAWPSLRGSAALWMARMGAPGRAWPPAYGKGNSVYGRYAAGCNQGIWPRLLAHLQAQPDLSAVRLDSTIAARTGARAAGAPLCAKQAAPESTRARARGGRAPEERSGSRAEPQLRRLRHPDPHLGGSTGPSPAPARDGARAPTAPGGLGRRRLPR